MRSCATLRQRGFWCGALGASLMTCYDSMQLSEIPLQQLMAGPSTTITNAWELSPAAERLGSMQQAIHETHATPPSYDTHLHHRLRFAVARPLGFPRVRRAAGHRLHRSCMEIHGVRPLCFVHLTRYGSAGFHGLSCCCTECCPAGAGRAWLAREGGPPTVPAVLCLQYYFLV